MKKPFSNFDFSIPKFPSFSNQKSSKTDFQYYRVAQKGTRESKKFVWSHKAKNSFDPTKQKFEKQGGPSEIFMYHFFGLPVNFPSCSNQRTFLIPIFFQF
jgi:hypothetical protein